ncbi:hypothetical protein EVA_12603 [gut metagenome]|uniref:Uncharacterized protein n=1 Tax=gut metagenome TaxID=749906 RepID=J9CGW6_9ZZZZ
MSVVSLHLLNELLSVLRGVKFEECLAEASRESRSGFSYTTFRTSKLSGEAREEVVLSLVRAEDRNGRKNAECVSRKEDNLLCSGTLADGLHDVLDVIDGVAYTRVLRYALVREVNLAFSVNRYVLKKSVTLDSAVDIGFAFLIEVDNLSVTTTFVVEHTVVIPSVLVVTDQLTLRVGRERSLTCTRETEEDSSARLVHVSVGRAVHRSDTFEGLVVVHHREHTLLHFTTIPSIDNYLFAARKIKDNSRLRVQTEFLVVLNLSLRSVVNNKVRFERSKFFLRRTDEHVLYEVSLPGNFHNKAHSHASFLVGTTETIY